jgi:uncharacterized protein
MKWYLLLVIKLSLSTIVFAQVPPAAAESSSYINRDTALGSANLQAIRKIHERSGSIITAFREAGIASPNMEWWVSGPEEVLSFSGTFKGLDGVADFQQRLNTLFRYDKVKIIEYIDGNDQIGVIFEGEGIARNTGRPFKSAILRLFTFVNGKVIKVRNFFDTDAYTRALQAR